MEPEKKKHVEDEFLIIDEQEELHKAAQKQKRLVEQELHTMTNTQREELKSQAKKYINPWLKLCAILVFVLVLFSIGGTVSFYTLWFGGFALAMGIMGLRKWIHVNTDLGRSSVNYIDGMIALDIVNRRGGKLSIGSETFTISKDVLLSLNNHQPYRVFYAPNSRFVLDIEPL